MFYQYWVLCNKLKTFMKKYRGIIHQASHPVASLWGCGGTAHTCVTSARGGDTRLACPNRQSMLKATTQGRQQLSAAAAVQSHISHWCVLSWPLSHAPYNSAQSCVLPSQSSVTAIPSVLKALQWQTNKLLAHFCCPVRAGFPEGTTVSQSPAP